MFETSQRAVVVTGVSRGIGRAVAHELLRGGFRVVGISRSDPGTQSGLVPLRFDLGDLGGLDELWRRVEGLGVELAAVVLNAGSGHVRELVEEDATSCRELLGLNFVSPYLLAGHAARYWNREKREGHLVLVGSQAGLPGCGQAYNSLYSASKAALLSLVGSLARELAPRIRVNAVAPGDVQTGLARRSAEEFVRICPSFTSVGQYEAEVVKRSLLERWVEPGEVAQAVAFLLNDSAATGTIINVSAGATIY